MSNESEMDVGDVNLQPVRVLGQGTFGRVFLCNCRHDKQLRQVCVKRIIVHNPKTEMNMILEEVYIISQLKHPHIVKFIRSFVHAGTVNIVMEYAPNGTMRDVITKHASKRFGIPQPQLMRYFCDTLMGLEYLHIRHVIHRDLKPENLLLGAGNRIQIADFGISAVHTPCKQYLNAFGTPYYMAPEILRGEKFDFKSDIWSLGCVLHEMCLGKNPFMQATNMTDLRDLIRELTRPSLRCNAILSRCGSVWMRITEKTLTYDPQRRISLPDILRLEPSITLPYYEQYFAYDYVV